MRLEFKQDINIATRAGRHRRRQVTLHTLLGALLCVCCLCFLCGCYQLFSDQLFVWVLPTVFGPNKRTLDIPSKDTFNVS